ncbi:pantothenate kinase [Pseudomonas sp. BMS12]|uniref:pantothenate kinase n=1 Tax=Pseudomonas sp. BMS12 TaxID=1796033 RepID=UPI00083B0C64|nr:pantothenate kinase [Pseudomonas sp. BMS12]
MILELDCGNSLIKWRLLGADGRAVCGGVVDTAQELLAAVGGRGTGSLRACRLVSVRSDEETSALIGCIESGFGVAVECARPSVCLGEVRNGYSDYSRLGLDRWLAVVGAYKLAGRACLVLDLGTAVTSDFVDANGEHLGGYICPGMPLMRRELGTHTRRIRYDDAAAQQALLGLEPGRTTAEAVERGCALMLRGFVLTQLDEARSRWGDAFSVYLTGGDAALVRSVLPQAHLVSDLVFIGLAEACPFPGE